MGNKVYAHASSDKDANQFDEMLWTFRQGSFVPHERVNGETQAAPVCIGTNKKSRSEGEVLINLSFG